MQGKSTKKKEKVAQNAPNKPLKAAGKKGAAKSEDKPKKSEVKAVKSELDAIDDLFATAKRKSNTNEQVSVHLHELADSCINSRINHCHVALVAG